MKSSGIISIVSMGLLYGSTYAGTMGSAVPDWRWVGTLSVGPAWSQPGDTQTFYLSPEIEKTYVAHKKSKALVSGELFAGIQKSVGSDLIGQLGLALGLAGPAKAQGIIWDDADPRFDNYSYKYNIRQTRVAVKGKLLKDYGAWVMPWISGSLGVGFNRAYSFNNTPLIFEAITNPDFGSKTKTAFTYTLGVGVQKIINEHWQAGVGYEFADWGKSQLRRSDGQTLTSGLRLSHTYTNGVLFNLTYVV
jgi:opacity protein-like surface antigen